MRIFQKLKNDSTHFSILASFLWLIPFNGSSQDTLQQKLEISHALFPVLFYLPETKFGIEITGIITFDHFNEELSEIPRVSQIQPGLAYTTNKQILLYLPFEFYMDRDRLKMKGELGYYKYFYSYYGTGLRSLEENRETYDVHYPRFQVNTTRRITQYFSTGILFRYDNFSNVQLTPGGLLEIDQPTGSKGGVLSAFGMIAEFDNRDDIFHPFRGGIGSISLLHSNDSFGSDFRFTKIEMSYSHYVDLSREKIIAIEVSSGMMKGDVPFYEMFYIGSPKRSRGSPDRRYMDRNILSIQQEYRFPLKDRIGATIFHSISTVNSEWSSLWNLSQMIYAYGAGLRYKLTRSQRVRLRADFAFSKSDFAFYFTIGEAF